MPPHLLGPVPFLHLTDDDDDDESPSDSTHSTPRSSFSLFIDPSDLQLGDDPLRRPHSLASFDSGYFSIMSKESPFRKPSRADLRGPLVPISNATDATQVSPKRESTIKSLLRKKKKSMISSSPPDLSPFAIGLSRSPVDDPVPQLQAPCSHPAPRLKPRDPSVDAFEELDRFVVRRGMKYHPYSRDDAPYMLAYDRTLQDK